MRSGMRASVARAQQIHHNFQVRLMMMALTTAKCGSQTPKRERSFVADLTLDWCVNAISLFWTSRGVCFSLPEEPRHFYFKVLMCDVCVCVALDESLGEL